MDSRWVEGVHKGIKQLFISYLTGAQDLHCSSLAQEPSVTAYCVECLTFQACGILASSLSLISLLLIICPYFSKIQLSCSFPTP